MEEDDALDYGESDAEEPRECSKRLLPPSRTQRASGSGPDSPAALDQTACLPRGERRRKKNPTSPIAFLVSSRLSPSCLSLSSLAPSFAPLPIACGILAHHPSHVHRNSNSKTTIHTKTNTGPGGGVAAGKGDDDDDG